VNLPVGSPAAYSPVWPWVGAWCGDIDLIGDQKPQSRYRDVVWGISQLEIAVQRPIPEGQFQHVGLWAWPDELPCWNLPGQDGKAVTVRVYSSAERVELLLNGKAIGSKDLTIGDRMRAEFTVPYQPGALEAVAWSGGKEVGRKQFATAGLPARLELRQEPHPGGLAGERLSFVNVDIVDAQGRVVPDDARSLSLSIEGSGQLAGFGSANPKAQGSFQSAEANAFRGRALAILRGGGPMRITVSAVGLASATALILPK
jgi:beta-galactosidase